MSSEDINKLFGDLRSALNKKDLLEVQNISKNMIKMDQKYYRDVVVNYVSSELASQGASMDPNTRIRVEYFKAWVRDEINHGSEQRKLDKISLFKKLLLPEGLELLCRDNYDGYDTNTNRYEIQMSFPSSVRFKIRKKRNGDIYYLSKEFQDALWVVLDEHSLL